MIPRIINRFQAIGGCPDVRPVLASHSNDVAGGAYCNAACTSGKVTKCVSEYGWVECYDGGGELVSVSDARDRLLACHPGGDCGSELGVKDFTQDVGRGQIQQGILIPCTITINEEKFIKKKRDNVLGSVSGGDRGAVFLDGQT